MALANLGGESRPTRSAAPEPGPDGPGESALDSESARRALRLSLRIAIWTWPSFFLLDLFMCFVVYPAAPLAPFLLYRLLLEATLVLVYRASLGTTGNSHRLLMARDACFMAASFLVSAMALHLGGLQSSYMHGTSIVILVRSMVIPAPLRRVTSINIATALAFPLVMGVAAAWMPEIRQAWTNARSLAVFASHYVFVLSTTVVGTAASYFMWAAQQQVYKARRLGRYRLKAPIGKGGMGEVWLAWDEEKRRNLVLKILRAGESLDPAAVRRFEREALATSKLRGPHTVRIYDFGASDDGVYYIAMEYLPGLDLEALVRDHGPIPPARAVRFAIQCCASLEEAHAAGIIHRDIKPANLFATRVDGEHDFLKVLDFGIARMLEPKADSRLTQTGIIPGTPAYLAPELWIGSHADARSDIYALGATIHFLLVGRPPFEGDNAVMLGRQHRDQVPPLSSVQGGQPAPPELQDIVLRCLAKAPEDRFQSATELRLALTRVVTPNEWTPAGAEAFWRTVRIASVGWIDPAER